MKAVHAEVKTHQDHSPFCSICDWPLRALFADSSIQLVVCFPDPRHDSILYHEICHLMNALISLQLVQFDLSICQAGLFFSTIVIHSISLNSTAFSSNRALVAHNSELTWIYYIFQSVTCVCSATKKLVSQVIDREYFGIEFEIAVTHRFRNVMRE